MRILAGLVLLAASTPASAKDIVVKMLNKGPEGVMVFSPTVITATVGDTIRFVPSDLSHNAASIPALWPQGVAQFVGKINKEVSFKITKPGNYGIKCSPHYAMGMVALIRVQSPPATALAAVNAAALPPFASRRLAAALATIR